MKEINADTLVYNNVDKGLRAYDDDEQVFYEERWNTVIEKVHGASRVKLAEDYTEIEGDITLYIEVIDEEFDEEELREIVIWGK